MRSKDKWDSSHIEIVEMSCETTSEQKLVNKSDDEKLEVEEMEWR